MRTAQREWTYEDYLKLNDDKRYEIIGGEAGRSTRTQT